MTKIKEKPKTAFEEKLEKLSSVELKRFRELFKKRDNNVITKDEYIEFQNFFLEASFVENKDLKGNIVATSPEFKSDEINQLEIQIARKYLESRFKEITKVIEVPATKSKKKTQKQSQEVKP
jgi:predicted metal-dependent hydrolase